MLIIIQESIKNRTNLVYQKSNEVHWVVLRIQHICNTTNHKFPYFRAFLVIKTLVFGNRIITTSGTELFPVFRL